MVHVWALKAILVLSPFWATMFLVGIVSRPAEVPPLAVALVVGLAVAIVIFAYGGALLYRRLYRWDLGEEDLRVWRGILFRKRVTIPYMRVQNVNVVRGPLLLLFGLSGVEVETAGQKGWYYGLYGTEGYLPGLVDGEAVADAIVERVRESIGREGL